VHGDTKVQLALTGSRDDLVLTLTPRARVTGTVVDDRGTPVSNTEVRARAVLARGYAPPLDRAASDGNGRFELLLAPGQYSSRRSTSQKEEGPNVDVRLGKSSEVTLRLKARHHVSGSVHWSDGTPAAGAHVEGDRADVHLGLGGSADDRGRYRLGPFTAGTRVVIRAAPPGAFRLSTRYRTRRVQQADGSYQELREELAPPARNVTVG
jgi:hypothetical protein